MVIISKQLACQTYIYKIHSSRLRKAKWNLTLPIEEARRNDEVIALASSQMLRWIDELNGVYDADDKARYIKHRIRKIRREPYSVQNRKLIKDLYHELDILQFKPDYMCLIIDKEKDYYRACRGFSINGVEYHRLLGTNGGIKNSTIVFVSERLYGELSRRVENGRDQDKKLVTAKLEAYKALTCSASNPVSLPNGIIVVDDVETEFLSDIIYMTDEDSVEPTMEFRKDELIKMDASDGFGIMLPSLAERWSYELGLDYIVSGLNTRFSFEKGMVFTFDFLDFAENVAGKYEIKDAWGNTVDVRDAELILTTSMVKLWDSYKDCDNYVNTSVENGYTFGIAKTCPKELESERNLNYQFIQSYELDDDDIDELIAPTMNEIKDVLNADWKKTLLFLKGSGITGENVERSANDFIKAIMIDHRIIDDPFVQSNIYRLIKNRINEAKVGVIKVHGNFSIISGDPYLLCQNMFGLEKTGLLKAGEIYNRYWADTDADKLACFRAPMTCHNNIRIVRPVRRSESDYWYQYMNACTIFNGWDTAAQSLNGADFDGDLCMLTDNHVLCSKHKALPTLMCAQRKAEKRISTEEDFVKSNIESFGNDIGKTTNWITSMFDVQAGFRPNSKEYDTLSYRIMSGQLFQQNAIDKAKGIICKPMPRSWHDKHAVFKMEADDDTVELYRNIVATKKPYFMRYIYPALMKEYNTYIGNTNRNALREFRLSVDELNSMPNKDLTQRQREFLQFYYKRMPVGIGNCVMNRICRKFENEFDGYIGKHNSSTEFDYTIMKSDVPYTQKQYSEIKRLYDDYNKRLASYAVFSDYERVDETDSFNELSSMNEEFRKECDKICPNRLALCNIVLDICYKKSSTKRFAWNMCGDEIIENLLINNNRIISYPTLDPDGDIRYCGESFRLESKRLEVQEDDYSERTEVG